MGLTWTNLGNLQNVTASGGLASLRLSTGWAYAGLLFVLSNTATSNLQAWSGTDTFRLKVNSRTILGDCPMNVIAAVQDARKIGPRQAINTTLTGGISDYFTQSETFPLIAGLRNSSAGTNPAQTPAGAFFLNFGQDLTSPLPFRRSMTLNAGAKGISTVDVEIQMGAYTSPSVQVWAWADKNPVQTEETEVVTMIQTTSLSCQNAGQNKFFNAIPGRVFRSLSFSNLTGVTEGFKLLVNGNEIANSVDATASNARFEIGQAFTLATGQQGTSPSVTGFAGATDTGLPRVVLQSIPFDAGGNVDNLFNLAGVQTDLTVLTDSVKSVLLVQEYVGNPLVD